MSKPRGPFSFIIEGNIVKVYLDDPADDESEFILAVDKFWLPSLIAILKEASTKA